MSTPIIEHIADFVATAIGEITEANGFNQTLTAARPKRLHEYDEVTHDLMAIIWQGNPESPGDDDITNEERCWIQPFEIRVIVIDSDSSINPIDTRLNQVRSDIEKKLCADKTCGGYASYLRILAPEYFEAEQFSGITIRIEVLYTVQYDDPYTAA